MRLNDITYKVRGAVFEVYNILGPGLLLVLDKTNKPGGNL